jgi:hypothetical protein
MKVANRGKSHQWEGRVKARGSHVEEEGPGNRLGQEGRVERRGVVEGERTRACYLGYAKEEEPFGTRSPPSLRT